MQLNEYQIEAHETAIYPEDRALEYLGLGLVSEAGEVAGKLKKLIRDGDSAEKREQIGAELGDVLWYLSELAFVLDVELNDVGRNNLSKLFSRKHRQMLGGSGDDR